MTQRIDASENSSSRPQVEIRRREDQHQLITTVEVQRDAQILEIYGDVTTTPTRYSVQVGRGQHIEPHAPEVMNTDPLRYAWRFLNHACQPNTRLRGRTLIATRDLAQGEELTFNYNSNEFEMAEPFRCWCSAHTSDEVVWVRGYKHLTPTEREALHEWVGEVSAHVLDHD